MRPLQLDYGPRQNARMKKLIACALMFACALVSNAQQAQPPRPAFVYFGATWCKPCQAMKANTFADKTVKAELKTRFGDDVNLYDVDQFGELARQCGVTSIPAYMVIDGGKVLKRGTGYKGAREFLEWLK